MKGQQFTFIDRNIPKQDMIKHAEFVAQIYERNLKQLKIEMTSKKKVQYQPRLLKKVNLKNGWYCNITDNQKINSQYTIFTVHGAPGDHIQWAGLQLQTVKRINCRWINFVWPGFDQQDQRRGNYDGTIQHACIMLKQLFAQLKLKKVIYCGHSMGSILGSYFMTKYRQLITGYINITGIVDQWYTGILTFYELTIASYGFNNQQWRQKKMFDNDYFRERITQDFHIKVKDNYYFDKIQFPILSKTQLCAYIKVFNSFELPQGMSVLFKFNRNLKMPRVLIFGRLDPLHEDYKVCQSIYNVCKSKQSYINSTQMIKILKCGFDQLKLKLNNSKETQIKIQKFEDLCKIQEYFCYYFNETGHNAHKRRPIQMAKIIQFYFQFIKIYQKYRLIINTSL